MSNFNFLIATALCLLILAPCSGQAETGKDYYFQIEIGPQWREGASDSAGSLTFDTGFALNGALGYRLLDSFRVEVEGGYYNNSADTLQPVGGLETKADGEIELTTLFGNLYYDISIDNSIFTPYVGIGLGSYKISVHGLTNDFLRTIPLAITSDSDWTLAWQAQVGTAVALNENLDMLVGYRYFHGNDVDMVNPAGEVLHPNAELHAVEIGIRYNF